MAAVARSTLPYHLTRRFAREAAARACGAALLVALGLTAAGPASAQLFPDNEARRAIVELREKTENDRKTLTDTDIRITEQLQQLQRSLLDLNSQIETLKGEVAKLRGANEQLARDLAEAQRSQKDLQQKLAEEQAKKAEAQKVTMDGREFVVEPDERRQFEEALGVLRNGDYGGAALALAAFQKRWPTSGYTDAARFWQANALYGQRDYKESLAVFKTFMTAAPDHPRVPEAMLAAANAHLEMKDTRSARAMLQDLIKQHPRSEAAQAGKDRLALLK
jgi:tol-pal system protein YbgF